MFWDKRCENCEAKVKTEWVFCPTCGIPLTEEKRQELFNSVDNGRRIERLEMRVPRFMLKPQMKAKGVSITITSDNKSKPKIDVKTYGHTHHEHNHQERPVKIPKITEEPRTITQRSLNKELITLNLPEVKNLDDIEIKQLSQSVEIKAFAGDKAYFKLIPIPSNAMVNNEFKDGVLKIEVSK